ncbi:ABC transporter ATP-binding protein [Actinocorallia longicatena]|uniref:ABC transporter ATP-binding protein n=1 Tax=Actinocorallia longicatena TaxID=111803 RepID=A0ABP6Q9D5_9ACTN
MIRRWLVVFAFAGAVLQLALPYVLGRTVDSVLAGDTGPLALCAALIAVAVACDALETWATGATSATEAADLRGRMVRRILWAGPALTRRFPEGELVTRTGINAEEAAQAVQARIGAVALLIPTAGGLIALTLIDPWLSLTLVAALVLIALALKTFFRASAVSAAAYQRTQGEIAGRLVDALAGARTIKAAGTGRAETARVLTPLPELRRHGLALWAANARAGVQTGLVVPLLEIAVLGVGGWRLTQGALSVGDLYAAVRYAVLGAGLSTALGQIGVLARARAARTRVEEILQAPCPAYGNSPVPDGPGELRLGDVVLPGGSLTAIVGHSGSGKTHLTAQIGRLAPAELPIALDGIPIEALTHDALRACVAYAFDRPVLLGDTLADAVTLGAPGADPAAAAARAGADAFVRALPEGYATALAEAPLSGGERQRLGLARAFAHPAEPGRPRLLILDDATSSLDTVTARRVGETLTATSGTRLVVTHRTATAAAADQVLWLDGGAIRACAPHRVLWDDPGYRAVFA